jgi:hypothetical protein
MTSGMSNSSTDSSEIGHRVSPFSRTHLNRAVFTAASTVAELGCESLRCWQQATLWRIRRSTFYSTVPM